MNAFLTAAEPIPVEPILTLLSLFLANLKLLSALQERSERISYREDCFLFLQEENSIGLNSPNWRGKLNFGDRID